MKGVEKEYCDERPAKETNVSVILGIEKRYDDDGIACSMNSGDNW